MKKMLFWCIGLFWLTPAFASWLDNLNEPAEPPTMEEAFQVDATINNDNTITAQFTIAEGNYLYRDKIRFTIDGDTPIQILPFSLPEGKLKQDDIFGETAVFFDSFTQSLALSRGQAATPATLTIYYQGCSETFNICYPPTQQTIALTLPAHQQSVNSVDIAAPLSESDRLAQSLAEDGWFTIILSFLGIGILLAFTPCVFPMIPILSSIIIGEGKDITTRRALTLSLIYVLAMSVTYTIAGLLTGLLGANLQALFQTPWVLISFSLLFVLLALSMFGFYELQLPQFLQNRLHQLSQKQQGGKWISVALMGLLSGLIVGPCLAPPLAGALIFLGQQGDPILGASALFAMSMGMGLPLLLIGTSAGTLLPKAGPWMNTIKSFFGVVMLALAIWILERILPSWLILLLWGGSAIIVAVYLGAFAIPMSGLQKCFKGLGLVLFIVGTVLLITGLHHHPRLAQTLHPLLQQQATSSSAHSGLDFVAIQDLDELRQYLANTTTPVMLDLYADWCVDCKTMEATTFQDKRIIQALSNTTLLQLDMTDNTLAHQALLKHYGIFGPPTILFFDAKGQEQRPYRLIGSLGPDPFYQHLQTLPNLSP